MRAKKIFAAGMVAVMCAGLMTGCGSNDTKSQFKKFSKCATIDKAAYTDIEYVPASREVSEDDVNSAISSFAVTILRLQRIRPAQWQMATRSMWTMLRLSQEQRRTARQITH